MSELKDLDKQEHLFGSLSNWELTMTSEATALPWVSNPLQRFLAASTHDTALT